MREKAFYPNRNTRFWMIITAMLFFNCNPIQASGYFTLSLDTVSATVGQTVNVPVTVQNFIEMISAQGTINFDTSELQFVQVSKFGLSSLNSSNFGVNGAPDGYITFSWTDPTLNGTDLANDSVFFALQFQVKPNACQNTTLSFGNTPTLLEFVDTSFNALANYTVSPGMVVPSGASVNPSISIQGSANICSGTSATYTAAITHGGANPVYQWRVNGVNTGPDSSVFTSAAFTNGQVVTCLLTSSSACALPDTALSNTITVSVASTETPSVQVSASDTTICSGTLVTFTANITSGGATPSFIWYKNGNVVGANSINYADALLNNNDSVWVVVTSSAPCATQPTATSAAIILTVNPVPAASVAGSNSPVISGDTIYLTATTSGGATYQWSGPDNFTSALQNPVIPHATSAMSGTYQVETFNVSGCHSAASTVNVLIHFAGHFTLYMDTVQAVAGQQVTVDIRALNFNEMLSAQGTISFDTTQLSFVQVSHYGLNSLDASSFGTSNLASGELTFSWADPTLQGTSLANDSDFFSLQFNVSAAACSTTALIFSASPTPLEFVDTSYTALDSFSLFPGRVNITGGVTVPSVTITGSDTVCPGLSANYTASAVNGGNAPSFQWKVNGVNAGNNNNTFSTSGLVNGSVVSCVLTSSLVCAAPVSATSNNIIVTVGPVVAPAVTDSVSANAICPGTPVVFTAYAVHGGTSPVYLWKKNGSTVGGDYPTYTDAALNNHDSVWVLMASNLACASPNLATGNTIVMTVDTVTVPSVTVTANENVTCAGVAVTFTAAANNGGGNPAFQWQLNGTDVGSNSNTYTSNALISSDSVLVILSSNAHCASPASDTSNKVAVIVTALPAAPVIEQSKDSLLSNAVSGNQWYFNGAIITGATAQVYVPHATGNYQDVVTGSGGCSSDTSNTISYVYLSIPDIVSAGIEVYPNPVNTILFVHSDNAVISTIRVMDVLGQTLVASLVSQNNYQLNVSGMAPGNYIVLVETAGSFITKRITVTGH